MRQLTQQDKVLIATAELHERESDMDATAKSIADALGVSLKDVKEPLAKLRAKRLVTFKRASATKKRAARLGYMLTADGNAKLNGLKHQLEREQVMLKGLDMRVMIGELNEQLCRLKGTRLEPGSYLVKAKKPDRAFELYNQLAHPGLCLTTTYPDKLRKRYNIATQIYWLSESEGEDTLYPTRLRFELTNTIFEFVKSNTGSVVIIDGIEYLILENGFDRVLEFLKSVGDAMMENVAILLVPVDTESLSRKELSLLSRSIEELPEFIELQSVPVLSLLDILHETSPDGVFDWETALDKTQKVDFSVRTAKLRYFFGRDKELEQIGTWVEEAGIKLIAVYGIAGIGKTTLINRAIVPYKQKSHVFWHDCHEWDTIEAVINVLSEFLARMNKLSLSTYIRLTESLDLNEVALILERDLRPLHVLLIFDDVHKVKEDVVPFFRLLIELTERLQHLTLITVGRRCPAFYTRRDVAIKKTIAELQLHGLDERGAKRLLTKRGIKTDKSQFDELYALTNGHPLALELIDSNNVQRPLHGDLRRYIEDEIFLRLNEEERSMMGLISALRYPIQPDILTAFIDHGLLDELTSKSLVQQLGDMYGTHDFIRKYFYRRLTPAQRKHHHSYIAAHYATRTDERSLLEALWHYIGADNWQEAIALIRNSGAQLIKTGYAREFLSLLGEFTERKVEACDWVELLTFKGDVLSITGEWDNALGCYSQALRLSTELGNTVKVAGCYRKVSEISSSRGDYGLALANVKAALKHSKKANDTRGVADAYYIMGRIHWYMGKLDDATDMFAKCLAAARKLRDTTLTAKTFVDFGNIYGNRGKCQKAVEHYNKGLKLFKQLDDKYGIARVYNNLGVNYGTCGEYAKAIRWYERAIKLSESVGLIRGLAYGLSNAAETYARLGNFAKAERYASRAKAMFERLGERRMIGQCHLSYGMIYKHKHEWTLAREHFEHGIKIANEVQALDNLAQMYYEYGLMCKEMGRPNMTIRLFMSAMDTYKKLANWSKVAEMEAALKAVDFS